MSKKLLIFGGRLAFLAFNLAIAYTVWDTISPPEMKDSPQGLFAVAVIIVLMVHCSLWPERTK